MLAGAVLLASPLAMATRLRPSAAGLGTHQQLGLPACSARVLWGVRCPACGMTTSWTHLVRGQLWQSLQANSGGTLLGLLAIAMVAVLGFHAAVARLPSRRWSVVLVWCLLIALVVTASDWAWRLAGVD